MKNNSVHKVGIVLPAYNEAKVISSVLKEIPNSIKMKNKDFVVNIIVVNDGSSDSTEQEVRKNKNVTLINHILNSGAGAATRTGINYARNNGCDYVITMDSDGQHHIDDVKKLITEISKNEYDFIIGSRLINSEGMPWYRVLAGARI